MSGRKKKLSLKLKRYNVILIIALIVLMLLLGVLMICQMFSNSSVYRIEPRHENIKKSQKNDQSSFKTIGWVRVQGTNIDYPLYGLIGRTFDYTVKESYLWSLNRDEDFHDMMIVYGHNVMNRGAKITAHDSQHTRMEQLMNFVFYDFAQKNQYIQLTINGEDYLYQVFAVNFMPASNLDEYPTGEWKQVDINKYVDRLLKESIYDFDTKYTEGDKVLSVVTCSKFFPDDNDYDFIVTGRMLRAGEEVRLSKVHRNKNYAEIDEILKGAEEDEESTDEA